MVQVILMGRRSDAFIGSETFGIGVIRARVHARGYVEEFNDCFTMSSSAGIGSSMSFSRHGLEENFGSMWVGDHVVLLDVV